MMEPRTKYIKGKHVEMKPWDVDTRMSPGALGKLTKSLISVQGYWTDAYTDGDDNYSNATFRVWIPDGSEQEFQKLSKVTLKAPPQPQIAKPL